MAPDASPGWARDVGVGVEPQLGSAGSVAGADDAPRPFGVLVDDGAPPGPGQIAREAFMDRLEARVRVAADEELAPVGRTAEDCPYLEAWLAFYRDKPAGHIERAIRHYASGARPTAGALAAAVEERVRVAVRRWRETGELSGIPGPSPLLPPAGAAGEAPRILRVAASDTLPPPTDPATSAARLGPGKPLDGGVRSRMERGLGGDLRHVRVHADATGAALARHHGARAFAVGEHVAFAEGAYRPGTLSGDAVLAHELAHVEFGGGGERAEHVADAVAAHTIAQLWAGAESSRLARPPALDGGLQLRRCFGTETKKEEKPEIVEEDGMRALGYSIRAPPGDPIVGRSYRLSLNHPAAPGSVTSPGSPTPVSLNPWDVASWHSQPPGTSEFRLREGVGDAHAFALDAAGQWRFAVQVPLARNKYGFLTHTATVRDPNVVARERLEQVKPASLPSFLVGLELAYLGKTQFGLLEQRFGEAFITLQGSNPARATANWPDLPTNVYTAHAPPARTPASYQWVAVPHNLRDYVTKERFGQRRATINSREGFDLGTGPTAQWVIANESGIVDIYCTIYDSHRVGIAEPVYRQVILTSEEQGRVDQFKRYVDEVRTELPKVRENSVVFVPAVHLATETGIATELSLFLGQAVASEELVFIDVTPGVPRREYSGGSFGSLINTFASGNSYPVGRITLRVPGNGFGVAPRDWLVTTSGASLAQRLSTGWGWASLGLAGLGALATVIPGAQPLAPAFFLASAGLAAASAAASLYQRSQEAHPSGTGVAIDIASLAGSLIGLAGTANVLRYGPRVAAATRMGQFVLYTGFATEAMGGVFLAVDGAGQIADILNGSGTTEQKVSAIVRILSGMLLNGTLLAWSAHNLSATRSALVRTLGAEAVQGLGPADLHALSILDEAALARLAGARGEDVRKVAALIREDPIRANRLSQLYGGERFLDVARARPGSIEELSATLDLQRRAALVGYAATQLGQVIDTSAASGLSRQLGVAVQIDTALPPRRVRVEYRLGSWLSSTEITVRVGPNASIGDLLLHTLTIDAIRDYRVLSGGFRGLHTRAAAWLKGRTMPRAAEVALELDKHAALHEARLAALRGREASPQTQGILLRDMGELQNWIAYFAGELGKLGAPKGIVGAQWSERISQLHLEAFLDMPGSGFQRYTHPSSGRPISEPGFRGGQSIDMGRAQAHYAGKLRGATFPDVYGTETATGQRVAMELKTPYEGDSVATFFRRPEVKDNLLREQAGRIEHLPAGTRSYLVVDLRGTGQSTTAALSDLSTVFRNYAGAGPGGDARRLWDGVRFITGSFEAPVLSGVFAIP